MALKLFQHLFVAHFNFTACVLSGEALVRLDALGAHAGAGRAGALREARRYITVTLPLHCRCIARSSSRSPTWPPRLMGGRPLAAASRRKRWRGGGARRGSTVKVPALALPQLALCAFPGRAWRLWEARHTQSEAQPLGAQCLGGSSEPPPKSPISPPLTML